VSPALPSIPLPCEQIEAVVERVLAPFIGATMARAATRGHYRALGIEGGEIAPERLEPLVEKVGLGLHIFVGRERTSELLATIRRDLAAIAAAAGAPA